MQSVLVIRGGLLTIIFTFHERSLMDKTCLVLVAIHIIHDFNGGIFDLMWHISKGWLKKPSLSCDDILLVDWIIIQMPAYCSLELILVIIHVLGICWLFVNVVFILEFACWLCFDHSTEFKQLVLFRIISIFHESLLSIVW